MTNVITKIFTVYVINVETREGGIRLDNKNESWSCWLSENVELEGRSLILAQQRGNAAKATKRHLPRTIYYGAQSIYNLS